MIEIASLAWKTCTFRSLLYFLLTNDKPFRSIFDVVSACEWDYVAALGLLPVLNYSVD